MEDERFKNILKDPKFRRIPKGERKIKIDKRFESMFKDEQFNVKHTVDKRGRPISHQSTEDLKRYYDLSSDDEDSEESEEVGKFVKAPVEDIELNENDKKITEDVKNKLRNLKVDYARGEAVLFSESSSDEEESDDDEDDEIDHKWGEMDAEADTMNEATKRLAACNMDWDRIRAVDIFVLLNSFLPPGDVIESVKIYQSEFGKQRMAEESISGPKELKEVVNEEDDEEEDNEEGSKFHMEKLRQYQLNRLKYFYAVITVSSVNAANKIYTECDGLEYESSATKVDLRFIPDDMIFEDEPKEVCDKMPDMEKYQPRFFVTTALQQAKVDLTWDETDPNRVELTDKLNKGKIDEVDETDLRKFLAQSSDESDSEQEENNDTEIGDDNPIEKYKALLQDIKDQEEKKKDKDVQMEITWGLGVEKKTKELVKKRLKDNEEKTPFQQYLDKRKEKRKLKKQLKNKDNDSNEDSDIPSDIDMNDPYFAEEFDKPEFQKTKMDKVKRNKIEDEEINPQQNAALELLLMDENEDDRKHFSLKKIQENESSGKKKKNKTKESDDFKVDVNDARFSAVFTSHHYNIDPSDPHFKKTQGMERLINEKLKRRKDEDEETTSKPAKIGKTRNAELSVLVKSVKRKAEALVSKKK